MTERAINQLSMVMAMLLVLAFALAMLWLWRRVYVRKETPK